MKRSSLVLLFSIIFFSTVEAQSRPISYLGGSTIVEESDRVSTSVLTHYTFSPEFSLGLRAEYNRDEHFTIQSIHPTFLIKRWFGSDYQGNLYLYGGLGIANGVKGSYLKNKSAIYGGIMADWETRSLFLGYRSRHLEAGHFGKTFIQAIRFGFTPYLGNTGDLHTWLMVEIDHRAKSKSPATITPMVRFFKDSLLVEIGYNLIETQPLINFTYRL